MIVSERQETINGMQHTVTTVDGLDRVQINNKLHYIGDQILKLKMQQDALIQMRNMIDHQHEMQERMNDLYNELFGG